MTKARTVSVQPDYEEYLRDESRRVGRAESIAFPRTEAEVREILADVRRAGVPATVQGARTGITAGAVPEGGCILNLSRMNRITGMRRDGGRFFVSVQPGVLLTDLRAAVASGDVDTAGWSDASRAALLALKAAEPQFFPPDPTETSASIGGMVSCNASGAQSFHYGPTRSHVEALRVVLPDGDVAVLRRGEQKASGRHFRLALESGRVIEGELPHYVTPRVKSAAGYDAFDGMDLIDLFIGMEGTLGIITEIEVALSPAPKAVWGVMAFLPSEESALRFVRLLRGERIDGVDAALTSRPVAIEFFNDDALRLLRRQKARNSAFAAIPAIPADFDTCVYVEYHGPDEDAVVDALKQVAGVLVALGGSDADTWAAGTPREMERLKFFRHAIPESVNLLIDERRKSEPSLTKLGTDMSVPDAQLDRVVAMYRRGLAENGLESVMFGHIGSNHLHVNILPRDVDDYRKGKALYLDWAAEVVRMGGSVSAEHGIGKLKTSFLELMYGADGVAEMHALKKLLDPDQILNPGNLFKP